MCDVQHWQVTSGVKWNIELDALGDMNTCVVFGILHCADICVKIWRELCGTYSESSRGLVLVLVCYDRFQVLPELEERGR